MSYGSNKRSESSASRRSMDGDTTEDGGDERDESKRRSRNLSEKKRRDQFNVLINELCSMVSTSPRKMDKSTVLKATIAFLKAHNAELSTQSQVQETQEDWKPSFLSNEEFTHLMLEALDGFIIVISSDGVILYLSESITSLLGYLSTDLVRGNGTIYDYIFPEERNELFEILTNPSEEKYKGQISLVLNFLVGGLETTEQSKKFQLVKLVGYFKRWISPTECGAKSTEKSAEFSESSCVSGNGCVLIATGRLVICDLLREMSVVVDSEKNEFSSRHSLEWKFLFLDHRAPPIIGYLPFEVLGTSGYDYYHVEDLEKVATCHEALMQRGEGTSCYYRFLTKGQQWIWLQTRFFITYHQWNSKPEFIVCTHRVVSYADVMKERNGETPSSAFHDSSRSGPSLAKQSKMESLKGSKSSSRQKNGGLNYGASKRNSNHRKLELPPKFATAMSPSRLVHPHTQPSALQLPQTITTPANSIASSNGLTIVSSKPLSTNVTMSLHPPGPQEVHTHQQPTLSSSVHRSSTTVEDVSVPVAPYRVPEESTFAANTTEAIPTGIPLAQGQPVVASTTPCILQEQLLKKHAELQRQIIEQQEELRRVSEQLLMTQCGWIQEPALLHPTSQPVHHHAQPVELQTAAPSNMTTYSPHSGPPQPPPPPSTSVSSPNNPESDLP